MIRAYDPAGQEIFSTDSRSDQGPESQLVLKMAGTYRLVVDGSGEQTGDYQFRLLDKATASEVELGTGIAGTFDNQGVRRDLYRFTLSESRYILFDGQRGNGEWRLYGPNGRAIYSTRFYNDPELHLGAGEYLLAAQGYGGGEFNYQLTLINQRAGTLTPPTGTPITLGNVVSSSISASGEQDRYIFTGIAGQQLFYDAQGADYLRVRLYDPTGYEVFSTDSRSDYGPNIPGLVLTMDGTYQVVVDGFSDNRTGKYQFRLLNKDDATLIQPDTDVAGTFDNAGNQSVSYRFTLTEDQYLYFDRLSGAGNWQLYGSNGQLVRSADFSSDQEFHLSTGDYWLVAQGRGSGELDYKFRIITLDFASTQEITLGNLISGALSEKGEQDIYTFEGSAGQQVFFDALSKADPLTIRVYDPAGQQILNTPSNTDFFADAGLTLTMDGVYRVVVDGDGERTGDYQFRFLDRAAAPQVELDTNIIGIFDGGGLSRNLHRFTLESGQYLFFDGLQGNGEWWLYDPQGRFITAQSTYSDKEFYLDAGEYLLAAQGYGSGELNYQFRITTPELKTSSLIIGEVISGSLSEKGEQDTYRFEGTAGQQLFFDALGGSDLPIKIYDPMGQPIIYISSGYDRGPASYIGNRQVLAMDGTYRLVIDGTGEQTGNYRFRLLDKASAPEVALDTDITGTFDEQGLGSTVYRFKLTEAQPIYIDGQQGSGSWEIYGPNGAAVAFQSISSDQELWLGAGEYLLVARGEGGSNRDYKLRIITPEYITTAFAIGQKVSGAIGERGEQDTYVFEGTAGQQLFFNALGSSSALNTQIYDPAGKLIFDSNSQTDQGPNFYANGLTLKLEGTYRLVIARNSLGATGSYQFRLLDKTEATEVNFNEVISGNFGDSRLEANLYRFIGTAGQLVYIDTEGSQFSNRWELYGPGGNLLSNHQLNSDSELTLSASGEYLLVFRGQGDINTNYQFRLSTPNRTVAELTFNNTIAGSFIEKGQQDAYAFTAKAGQQFFLDGLSNNGNFRARLYSPSQRLVWDRDIVNDFGIFTLTEAGDYELVIDGNEAVVGNYQFALNNLSTSPRLNVNQSVTGAVDTSKQVQFYRVDGSVGQILDFNLAASSWVGADWILYGTNNQVLAAPSTSSPDFRVNLPTSGSYTLAIYRTSSSTVNYAFTVTDLTPPPVATAGLDVLVGETTFSTRQGSISAEQIVEQTFTASSGTRLYFDSKNANNHQVKVTVLNPDRTPAFSTLTSTDVGPIQLAQTGNYTVRIEGVTAASTGNYHFSLMEVLTRPPAFRDDVRRLTLNAEITKPLDPGYTTDILAFEGAAGQQLLFDGILPDGANFNGANIDVRLINPSGQVIFDLRQSSNPQITAATRDTAPFTLTETGTYNLLIGGNQPTPADYRFKLWDLAAAEDMQRNRVYADNLLRGSNINLYKIQGAAGERLFFDALSGRSTDQWVLYRPGDAAELIRRNLNQDFDYVLPVDGEYVLAIQGGSTTPANYRFAVSALQDPQAILIPGAGESGGTMVEDLGTYKVQLKVSDGQGGSVIQEFKIKVHPNLENTAPTVISDAVPRAFTSRTYQYDVDAIDADGDTLSYSLAEAPQGMFIDNETGEITWRSPLAGAHRVKVRVMDANGGIDYQTFDLSVSSDAVGKVTGVVYNDLDSNGVRKLTNPNDLTPYTGLTIGERFAENYTAYDLGVPKGLPYGLGGMTFYQAADGTIDPNTVLIAAAIHSCGGVIFKAKVQRGDGGHIIGFDDDGDPETPYVAEFFSYSPYVSAGVTYSPDHDLFRTTAKGDYSGLALIPAGLPGAGQLKATSQGQGTGFFTLDYHNGTYGNPTQTALVPPGSTGFVYLPVTAPGFDTGAGLLMGNFEGSSISAYQIDSNGNPVTSTALPFITDFENPMGALVDPITGDLLFSSAGQEINLAAAGRDVNNSNTIVVVRGLGTPDGNEAGLESRLVYVDRDQDSRRDASEEFTYTDTLGRYSFILETGTYQIRQELQPGWTQTSPIDPIYRQVSVVANETSYGVDFGNFSTFASDANADPVISSIPEETAKTNDKYLYRVTATDLNGDDLSYELVLNPDGMAIAPNGTVSWRPGEAQVGAHEVIVRVSDGEGGTALQAFTVMVQPGNHQPLITSIAPTTQPQVGNPFQYQVTAADLDRDTLTYSFVPNDSQQNITPTGIAIHAQTGLLTWTPTANQVGGAYVWGPDKDIMQPWQVTVKVSDGHGGESYQQINLLVDPVHTQNQAPVIDSEPRTSVRVGTSYAYAIAASDPEQNVLTYTLVSGPPGMTLQNGVVRWTPAPNQVGQHEVRLQVSDGTLITQQDWTVTAANTLVNYAPLITSVPTQLIANVDKLYQYDLTGIDPDHDALFWGLEQAPSGMVIEAQTGALRWQPSAAQIGTHEITVQVVDQYGAFSTQTFTVKVTGINAPPAIVSTPLTRVGVGQAYTYAVVATDPENHPLTFALGKAPAGMQIHPQTGKLTWVPQAGQIGRHMIDVQAIDSEGAISTQTFSLEVQTAAVNQAPVIHSTPIFLANAGTAYTYQVTATDPDAGDALTYQLLDGPVGMTVDPITGGLNWETPTIGTYQVAVGAVDQQGLGGAQGFTLTVRQNHAPVIESRALETATLGNTYRYDVRASDADGDRLRYSLDTESSAKGMAIDELGRLVWNPTPTDVGIAHRVMITVRDSQGATVEQTVDLTVMADTEQPKVTVFATQTLIDKGAMVTLLARATDNVKVENLTLVVNGQAVVLDADGRATVKLNQAGFVQAVATAKDAANNTGSATTTIEVVDPNATFDPNLDFDLPDVVTAPTQFRVDGEGVTGYKLEVSLAGTKDWQTLTEKTGGIGADEIAIFDPSLLQNDAYTVRLSLYGANGSVATIEDEVNVEGELKLGNFRLSFTDLAIPVTGIPITLTRTYDTLTSSTSDDFGYGWRMEFRDTDLRTSLGSNSPEEQELGLFKQFKDSTKVYITLPGGKRESFTFAPKLLPELEELSYLPQTLRLYHPAFESEPGSTMTLSTEQNFVLAYNSELGTYNGAQGYAYNPANPYFGGVYVLTSKDGTTYRIDAQTGDLLTVKDTNGNTVTYTDAAITSSTGQKVTFERDAKGRITLVKDPEGELIRYVYDANGDLVSVSDREQNTTRLVYDASYDDPNYPGTDDAGRTKRSHFLREIIDPLGRTGARTEYDENGRLKQIVDVNGKAVGMSYDTANDRQVVKDQLGNETVYVYDDRGNVLTEIDAEGKVTQRKYDDNNWVIEETVISDRSDNPLTAELEGFTTKYSYDSKGNKLTETDSLGNTTYYSYGALNRLLTETDSLGRTTHYSYDGRGNLSETKDANGVVTKYGYDSTGQLQGVTDANGEVTRFAYTSRGDVYEVKDAQGNITNYTYNRRGDKLTERHYRTKADGTTETLLTTWTYDDEGRVKTMTDADNRTTTYEYDKLGRQIAVVNALGRRSTSVYNDKGELVEVIVPDGTPTDLTDNPRVQYRYDDAGRKIAEIDPLGRETRFIYDKVGRLVETILPDSTPTDWNDNARSRTEYYSDGMVKAQIDELGHRTEFRYDAAGRQIAVIVPDATPNDLSDNPTTRYEYDKTGQQTAVTDALGHTTRYVYDDLGRLITTRFQDQTVTTSEYDKLGRRVAVVDQNGKRTEYRYDDLGRLTGVKDALNQWTEYGYNEQGQMIWQEDANDHRTRYEYDGLGRRIATILPLSQRSTMTYDAVGNVQSVTDFNGETITYRYDEQNRLTQKSFQDGSKVVYTYTRNGLQDKVTMVDVNGVATSIYDYDYDLRDRLTQRTDILGAGSNQTSRAIEYGYDLASNRTSLTTASGTTTYTYDERNRLDVVRLNGQLQADYDYDAISNLTQTTFGNGTQETRAYDSLNRLQELSSKRLSDNALLSKYVYTLDKVGNRKTATETVNGKNRSIAYTYDDLYRLTDEGISDVTNDNRTSHYVYDAVGNRQTKTINGVTTTYTYDANDRLLNGKVNGAVTTSYTYDNNGSTKTKTENGITTTYTWNDEKRLVSATVGNTITAEYVYNDQGIRVASKQNGVEMRYLLDEGIVANVWEEYAPDGTVQASYVYGNDLITQAQVGQTSYYLVDGLGSTRLLTDTQGQVLNSYDYEAFGQTVSQTGSTSNKYQYAGEQFDATLGDYYLRQRFYDTSTGRFGRMDTYEGDIENSSSIHKYVYTGSNPVIYTDPSGFIKTVELLAAFKVADILFTLAFPDPISIAMLAAPPGVPAAFAKGLGKVFNGVARGAVFSRMALGTARFGQAGKDSVDATRAFMAAKNIKSPFISDEYLQSLKAFLPSRTANKVADFVSEGSNGLVFVEAKSAITTSQLANSINAGGKMTGTRSIVEAVYQRGGQAFPGIEKQIITATDVSKIPTGTSAGKISKVPTSIPGEYQVFQNGAPAMPNGVPVFLQEL